MFSEKMVVSLDSSQGQVPRAVKNIENRGHVLYIRYLFTKRYSPMIIHRELGKMGLPVPEISTLTVYFNTILWPAIEKFHLQSIYADYKGKLNGGESNLSRPYFKNVLVYRYHIAENEDVRSNFLRFLVYLDVENMWSNELIEYYGCVANFPKDPDGTPVMESPTFISQYSLQCLTKILRHPKRYIIDQMILEEVNASQIAEYVRNNLDEKCSNGEILVYQKNFFNIRAKTLEEKIKQLSDEKDLLEEDMADLEEKLAIAPAEQISELTLEKQNLQQRIDELADSLYTLNSSHQEAVRKIIENKHYEREEVMHNIMGKAYEKFLALADKPAEDTRVIGPMMSLAKICVMVADKAQKETQITGPVSGSPASDSHASDVILQLYKQREEDVEKEIDAALAEIGDEEIAGMEELSPTFTKDYDE